MKRLTKVVLLALVSLAAARAYAEEANTEAKPKKASKKEAVVWPMETLKWNEIPNTGGAQVANLWGDMIKGAHGSIVKIPAGNTPLHVHTNDVKHVVISGTWTYTPEGGAEQKLGPGSYLMVPGNTKHASACEGASGCVLFQEQSSKFDMKPVAEPAAKKEAPKEAPKK